MSLKTPINNGLAQSDFDFASFKARNANLSDYAGANMSWNTTNKQFDAASGGGGVPLGWINVKAAPYNAKGDGVTDDSAAINSAIAAASSAGGGTIYFPRGTYICNGAFDATTNSILKVPIRDQNTVDAVVITLRGELPGVAYLNLGNSTLQSIILTSKTGTGTAPALLATNAFNMNPLPGDFNNTYVFIKDMSFQISSQTMWGLRLERAVGASLENVEVAGSSNAPVADVVGICMPACMCSIVNRAANVHVIGFNRGWTIGEHFHGYSISAWWCTYGFDCWSINEPSAFEALGGHCTYGIHYTLGSHAPYCPYDIFMDYERANTGNWFSPGTDIHDPGNIGRGIIRYAIIQQGIIAPAGPITRTGGANIQCTDLYNPNSGGWTAPTGTDLRSGYATSTATLPQVAQTLKSLVSDLTTLGVLRP